MKIKYYLVAIVFLGILPACSDWLDVRPKAEVIEQDMFQTESGFQDVLMGVYTRIAGKSLYGEKTTILFTELMAQHWTTSSSGDATQLLRDNIRKFKLESSDVQEVISEMWLQYYQSIINLNSILEEIDSKKMVFASGNYELVKGEALALRAFLHFDILRLWGPVPKDAVAGEAAIPYVRQVSKNPNELQSVAYEEVLKLILADLDAAELLLKDDPIIQYNSGVLKNPGGNFVEGTKIPEDPFHFYRQNRFNIYAVKATKARYYLWIGEKAKALQYAKEVISAVNTASGTTVFKLADESTVSGSASINGSVDLLMTVEHIFAIHNTVLQQIIKPLFLDFGGLTQSKTSLETAYESVLNSDDIRMKGSRTWEEMLPAQVSAQKQNMFKKYWVDNTTSVQLVPVIRLAEMYLIAIECAPTSEANELFKAFRISRNMDRSLDGSLTEGTNYERLEKEYRKEFYGEGQMFYFYKRQKIDRYTWPTPFSVEISQYRIPKPQDQTIFE